MFKLSHNITDEPGHYLATIGDVFAIFDRSTDSGNVSYGVLVDGVRYFVKTAGSLKPSPCLTHQERLALLQNAVELAGEIDHPAMPRLLDVVEGSPHGPMLVYEWAQGELLGVPKNERDDPASAYQRFIRLPAEDVTKALSTLFDLHEHLAGLGWVAVDLYDGCLIYDFDRSVVNVIDLDTYHRGPFTNTMGEMFGSSRFMTPEETTLGASIDQRTTVFTLGRFASVFLSDGSLDRAAFRGTDAAFDVMAKACRPEPSDRFQSVAEFNSAWRSIYANS